MIEMVIASNNLHKIREIQRILGNEKFKILSLSQLGIQSEPEENGKTFKDNALIKALDIRQFTDKIIIADDSGLIVPSLDNQPGVYSKRYAGENATDEDNNKLLISNLVNVEEQKRKAMFISCLCILVGEQTYFVEGVCHGTIILEPKGTNGFGYDPIFFISEYNKTFAELTEDEKNSISHRGKAVMKMKKLLEEIIG
ncbi:MAG: XTP/dITP diphosphatase [Clostridia bacterium]|nr:XTP/dITP diphosphatase [Clostridia bacterium]